MFTKTFLKDLAERAVATAVQTFVALYAVGDLSSMKNAAVAGVAAGLSVVKGLVASQVGDKSASTVAAGYERKVVRYVEVPVETAKKKATKKAAPAKKVAPAKKSVK